MSLLSYTDSQLGSKMKLFQVVKALLDDIYSQIPLLDEDAKDVAILNHLKILREKYPSLTNGITIDYSDPITRFAYYYRYVSAHAFTVFSLIKAIPDLGHLFDRDKTSVCCLGGGPGSDLLGVLKFIKANNQSTALMCRVYDKEERWRESLGNVCNLLTSFNIFPTFRVLDVTAVEALTEYPEILHDDLLTISFLMSEVYSKQEQAEVFFQELFRKVKPSAWMLFVDNCSGYASSWFDKLVKAYNQSDEPDNLKLIKKEDRYEFLMETGEQMTDLDPYFSKFRGFGRDKSEEGGFPIRDSKVDYRIYRKV